MMTLARRARRWLRRRGRDTSPGDQHGHPAPPSLTWPTPQLPDVRSPSPGETTLLVSGAPGARTGLHPNTLPSEVPPSTTLTIEVSAVLPGSPWCGIFGPVGGPLTDSLRALAERCRVTRVRWDVPTSATDGYEGRIAQLLDLADHVDDAPGDFPFLPVAATSAIGDREEPALHSVGLASIPIEASRPDRPVVCSSEDERSRREVGDTTGRAHFLVDQVNAWAPRLGPARASAESLRTVVTGYNLKFAQPLLGFLDRDPRFAITIDPWEKFRVHDTERTRAAIRDADLVFCEWCGPNAVLASHEKQSHQTLVVRLHRFELEQPEWRDVEIDRVDAVIAVSEGYRRRILDVTGWPADRVRVVGNPVDVLQLDRPKLPAARFTLGFISPGTSRKRLDLALEVLARLRDDDPRFVLRVKGAFPWTDRWVLDRPEEVAYFSDVADRLRDDAALSRGVVFDPPGRDVPAWLRQVGFVLSTSDDESFHLAPAEGMASSAVPVVLPWPGAETIYDPEWIVPTVAAMASRIAEVAAHEDTWRQAGERARAQVAARYRLEDVAATLADLLHELHRPRAGTAP